MGDTKEENKQVNDNNSKAIFQCVYEITGQLNLIREDLKQQNKNIVYLLGIILVLLVFILHKFYVP